MSSKTLIFLERYFWNLLCVLLNFTRRLAFWFIKGTPKSAENMEKILFVKLYKEDSFYYVLPMLDEIKKKWPNAEVDLLYFGYELVQEVEEKFNNLYSISTKSIFSYFNEIFKQGYLLSKNQYDIYFDLEANSPLSAMLSDFIGGKISCGFIHKNGRGISRDYFLTHKVMFNERLHRVHLCLSMITGVEHPSCPIYRDWVNKEPVMDLTNYRFTDSMYQQDDQDEIYEILSFEYPYIHEKTQFVALAPFECEDKIAKLWPLNNYLELAKGLLSNRNVVVILIGSSGEGLDMDASEFIKKLDTPRAIDLTKKIRQDLYFALFSLCDLFITNNNPILYYAAISKIRTLALCGPDQCVIWKQASSELYEYSSDCGCSPCVDCLSFNEINCCDNQCMKKIEVEQIYDIATYLLKRAFQESGVYLDLNKKIPREEPA